jgi:lipopolysaccharide export system permease protein
VPKLLFFYLARRILIAAVVVQLALTLPVVLTALFHHLPPAAMRGGLIWPAFLGTIPTVTYIALPMAIGVAAALEFSRMSADGMMAVLYSLRLSVWAICRPALACALLFTIIGYVFSCWIAPAKVGTMHDVINVIRHSLNHRMLEPGQFYTFGENQRTIYLERWETPDIASGVFIRQVSQDTGQEETISAARAEFRRNEQSVVMILSHGSIQSRAANSERVRVAQFDEYAISVPMQGTGGLPPRPWIGVFELSLPAFLDYRRFAVYDPKIYAEWVSEATKRLAVPFLALSHTILGIGLVLSVASATGRRATAASAVIAVIPAVHVAVLIAAETLVRLNASLWIAIAAIIVAELVAGMLLIQRQQSDGEGFSVFGRRLSPPVAAAS